MALGTATFYKCTDDPRVANKTVTAISGGVTGTLKPLETLSNLEARIVVNYIESCMVADYFSIVDNSLTMYYKITNRERGLAGEMIITGTLDSVLTYWNTLKTCKGIVARSSKWYDGSINDPMYPVKQRMVTECFKLFDFPEEDEVIIGLIE